MTNRQQSDRVLVVVVVVVVVLVEVEVMEENEQGPGLEPQGEAVEVQAPEMPRGKASKADLAQRKKAIHAGLAYAWDRLMHGDEWADWRKMDTGTGKKLLNAIEVLSGCKYVERALWRQPVGLLLAMQLEDYVQLVLDAANDSHQFRFYRDIARQRQRKEEASAPLRESVREDLDLEKAKLTARAKRVDPRVRDR